MHEPIRILGIDPGLRRCGWGVIARSGSRLSHVAHGVIAPPSSGPLADRLAVLYRALCEVVEEHAPHQAAVEETFVNANPASALKLGHARAAALLAPAISGVPVGEYAPRLIKKAVVGNGGADKNQVATMISVILPGAKAQADAADALAVAVCHAHHATLAPVLAR